MALMTESKNELLRSMFSSEPYKPGQGAYARGGTLAGILLLVVTGVYAWSQTQAETELLAKWIIPLAIGMVVAWLGYRLIHYPRFADFLISTEAEMNKVSWPGKSELRASTIVVLITTLLFALFMFAADTFWQWLLWLLGILNIAGMLGGAGGNMFHIPPLPTLWDWATRLLSM